MANQDFGHWLRAQLVRREWSQADFARALGVSTGRVSEWFGGKRVPSTQSIDRIADVLNVDVDLVLTLAGHRPAVEELDPDDPRRELVALVRRVRLTPDRIVGIRSQLRGWIDDDLRQGKGEGE